MKKYFFALVSILMCLFLSLTSCDFEGSEPDDPRPGDSTGSNSMPSNPNIFTANGTTYYYGKYSNGNWSIGTGTINKDYGYYYMEVEDFDSQLSPEQLKEYYSGTLYNINSVVLRLALEDFNPLMAKVGDAVKLRYAGYDSEDEDFTSRFYFYYNNAKNQIRYTFSENLKGVITFLGFENNILTLNLNNVYVYRTGTSPEDAPLQFVLNGRISFLMK